MANGEEDLREKNKDHVAPKNCKKYTIWQNKLGREDAEMLREKSQNWNASGKRSRDYDD